MGQQSLTNPSVARSRSTVPEAVKGADVPFRFGEARTAALSLLAAVFSLLGIEDLGKGFEVRLEV